MIGPSRPTALARSGLVVGAILVIGGCGGSAPDDASAARVANATPAPAPGPGPEVATGPATAPPAEPAEPPRLEFVSTVLDLGAMSETETRSGRFAFVNAGGSDLVIADMKATCGCTVPTLDRDRYAPGEEGHIDVVLDPAGPGPLKKYIDVLSNVPSGRTRLMVKAEVQAFVAVEPRMMRLGVLRHGREHTATVTVAATSPELEILSVRTSNPHVEATPREVAPEAGRPRWEIDVTIAPEAAWGSLFSWVEIAVRGRSTPAAETTTYTAKVRVQGQLFGELHAEPDTLRFGVKPGEAFERRIELRRRSGVPFRVTEVTLEAPTLPGATVRFEPTAEGYDLVLNARGTDTPSSPRGRVIVVTDVPGEEQLELPIVGVVRPAPRGVQ